MKKLVLKALAEFGINEVESISRIEDKDMWNIDDKYFIKTYNDLTLLEKILLINTELSQAGVPVAVYNKTQTGELCVEVNDVYYTITNKVSGSHIDFHKNNNFRKEIFSFGENIAKMHMGLKQLSGKMQCAEIADLMGQLHGWILKEITEKNIGIRKEIIDYCISFDELYHALPLQIIHRDLHGDNMLFENGKLSAFIDFDINQVNARLFDICYCMDLGVGNNKNDDQVTTWLEMLRGFLSGYNTISEITNEELDAIPYMFILIQLLTVAFWVSRKKSKEMIDENIEYLDWLYYNKHRFLFSRQDILT
jgi:Ser/Thr protein kinase RdoA (MazF antagonist)